MNWSDVRAKPSTSMLRQFSVAWLVLLLGWGVFQWLVRDRQTLGIVMMVLALAVGLSGLFKPSSIAWIFSFLMVVAFPIGWIVSHLMLLLMFYGIITPVALVLRLFGRDALRRKLTPHRASFWIPKEVSPELRRYFRQY